MAIKVYVDQGHNPRDFNTGAEGNGYFEQDITYTVGRRLFTLFYDNPSFEPRLSRPTPDTVLGTNNSTSLIERVRAANNFGADLFLSLHTNAAENPAATGNEALVYGRSAKAATAIAAEIMKELTFTTGLRNRGVVDRPDLYVLRRTKMPAVLVEMGFITNPTDADLLVGTPYLFALGIYRGVLNYYGLR